MRCSGLGLALLLHCLTLPSRALACVVGTGTGTSCTESALDACLPGGGSFDGTVTFNCGGATTITVTSTKTISADTTIDGGSLITISGGHSVGVFSVNTGVTFTVQNLTIANGNSASYGGGGIFSAGTLTVSNSTFSGNSADDAGGGGGICSYGTSTVSHSTFSGNSTNFAGGGIFNGGTVTVTNSTFSGNSANGSAGGAGIFNTGTLTLTNSALSGNYAYNTDGGGIFNGGALTVINSTLDDNIAFDANGGGIYNGGTVTVINSTFGGNGAGNDGGGISNSGTFNGSTYSGGTLTITNSTFTRNYALAYNNVRGAGIYNYLPGALVTVTNTIVASNMGGNCAGGVTDGGHNIDDDQTCGFTGTGCTSTAGTSFCDTNPVLDPTGFHHNGGPTQTIALQAGSPAINAGDESVCAAPPVNNLDQRGYVRPGDGATSCSIGAYEYNSVPASPTTCIGDCNGDGQVTVDEILTMMNIALGNANVLTCLAGAASHDGQITVDEILTAVNNVLLGCAPT